MIRTDHPIFNAIRAASDKAGFVYDAEFKDGCELVIRFQTHGSNGHWASIVLCREDAHVLKLLGFFPAAIQNDRASEIQHLLNRLNQRIDFGCFHFADHDRTIVFQLNAILAAESDRADLVGVHLHLVGHTMNDTFPAIMAVAYGGQTAEQALKQLESAKTPQDDIVGRSLHHAN